MQTRSAKAKGRRLAKKVRDMFIERFIELHEGDITVTPSSVNGPDLIMSPEAKKKIPYAIEIKNQERLNVWAAIDQAKKHGIPMVVFSKNHEEVYVTLPLRAYLWHEIQK